MIKQRTSDKLADKKIKSTLTIFAGIAFILLGLKHALIAKSEMILDVIASIVILSLFFIFYKKMHQDNASYFFLIFFLVLHNIGLYETSPLGLRFDHYMHFIGGFTIALIADRFFKENLSKAKRLMTIVLFALGLGAIGEMIEWLGYGYKWYGNGFFQYGIGDEGEYKNSIFDMVFNGLGALMMGMVTLFRKSKKLF